MLRASTSVAKRLQFRALIGIPKNARGETGVLFKGKNMARCFHFHFALKTEQERERGGDWRARGRRPAAVSPRSARAECAKWGQYCIALTRRRGLLPRSQTPLASFIYALALHDNDLYCVSSPIGVLLVISEARLEVVVNIAALGARVQK
jgi:hypothetical protein